MIEIIGIYYLYNKWKQSAIESCIDTSSFSLIYKTRYKKKFTHNSQIDKIKLGLDLMYIFYVQKRKKKNNDRYVQRDND